MFFFFLALFEVCEELHKAREFWGIGENCRCKDKIKELDNEAMEDGEAAKERKPELDTNQPSPSPQEKLAEVCGESSSVGTEVIQVKTEIESSEVNTEVEASKVEMETEPSEVKTESSKGSDVEKGLEKITEEETMDTLEIVAKVEVVAVTDTDEIKEDEDESAVVVSSGIGALSLLLDYESPPSSPVQSLDVPMDTEEVSQKTPGICFTV